MRRRDHQPLSAEELRDLEAMDAVLAGTAPPAGSEPYADLGAAVRAVRPTPTLAFAAGLDRRISGGEAPAARPRTRSRWLTPGPMLAALGSMAFAVVVVVNVAGGPGGRPVDEGRQALSVPAGGPAMDNAAPAERRGTMTTVPPSVTHGRPPTATDGTALSAPSAGGAAGSAAPSAPSAGARPRKVERNATLRLSTSPARLDDVVTGVLRTVDALGGYVASSSVERHVGAGSATFDLRVPVDRLPAAMARLSRLGGVRARSEDSVDLTGRIAGATDRSAGLAAERRALLRQLGAASTPQQTARLRTRLRVVERRLDLARAERDALRRRAAYSTIDLEVAAHRPAPSAGASGGGSWTPGDALRDAGRVLGVVVGGLLVGLSALLPFALLVLAGWAVARTVRRRRRTAALDGPA